MMKMRQQQESSCINKINRRKALQIHNNSRFSTVNTDDDDDDVIKGSLITMPNYGLGANCERDESPVSVISHSATVVSQPSSGCTSMEHHLHHPPPHFIHPNLINKQKLSMATSAAASTPEDDTSAFNLPTTLFSEVAPLQEALTKKEFAKSIKRKGPNSKENHVADSFNSEDDDDDDDDEHMISIDLTGLHENPLVLRENFLKGYGKNLSKEEERQAEDKISAKLKQLYGEWKEQKLTRSTSGVQEELLVRSKINAHASNAENSADTTRTMATNYTNVAGNYEGKSIIGPQLAPKSGYFSLEKASLNVATSRKRGINSAKVGVSSKWDDAEKWLCYDNHHVSSRKKAENSGTSVRNSQRNHANHVNISEDKSSNSASANGENLKVHQFKDAMQNIDTCASQSSNSNEKCTAVNNPRARQICDVDHLGSGEIVHPHVLNHKLADISVSDCEVCSSHKPYLSSQTSVSSGSISGAEKTKDNFNKQTSRRWIRDKRNNVMGVQLRTRECDYLSSGEIATNNQNSAANCTSDGEIHASYASDQQYNSNASYTQIFKKHLVLQKLRRKCSPNDSGNKGALKKVGEISTHNFFAGKNAVGRTNVHAVSRLSNISVQASPQTDPMFQKGESDGYVETKKAREDIISEARMQTEFVVQTPTHGRSACMKDACTEVSPSLSRRDMGTQMTPSESSPITSKCTSPLQNTSPARHNTPAQTSPTPNRHINSVIVAARDDDDHGISSRAQGVSRCRHNMNVNAALELESCHWAKLQLRELPNCGGGQDSYESLAYNGGVEEEININEGDYPNDHSGGLMEGLSVLDSRAAAWEEAERVKFNAKYTREEARIKTWESLQRAKAQAELKKLEVKLERLRSRATERVLSRMAAAEKRAEEMRAAAEAQQNEQTRKVRERACKLRKNALFPGSFAVCFARNFVP